ncbi:MAG: hypothetical protein OJI67_13575 [Prosthecobacter sp.]|nr:hypothetical protein [Prosthecobacter sp.]
MPNTAKTDKKSRLLFKLAGNLAFAVLGLLILLAAHDSKSTMKDFWIAASASILAVGFTGILSAYIDRSIDSDLFHYLSILEDERLTSREGEDLLFFRAQWHCYHITLYKNTTNWVYTVLDLSGRVPGQLAGATFHVPTKSTYQIRAFLRRDKFVMVHSAASDSLMSPSISIFPNCRNFGAHHSGIMQHVDYHGTQRIDPIMISRTPLVADLIEGSFISSDSEHYKHLMELWREDPEMDDILSSFTEITKQT